MFPEVLETPTKVRIDRLDHWQGSLLRDLPFEDNGIEVSRAPYAIFNANG
jgi:hypothetical protein